MTIESTFLHMIISLGILLFAAKLMAELFHRIKLPVVLGELLAGIIVGPFAIGGLPLFNGEPLVVLDETVRHIGENSAIVILFVAGLHITPREFLRGGAASFTVGSLGVVVPFFVGYYVFTAFGIEALQSMLIATALTATSIAISIQVLTELGRMHSKEARLILGAAIVSDPAVYIVPPPLEKDELCGSKQPKKPSIPNRATIRLEHVKNGDRTVSQLRKQLVERDNGDASEEQPDKGESDDLSEEVAR